LGDPSGKRRSLAEDMYSGRRDVREREGGEGRRKIQMPEQAGRFNEIHEPVRERRCLLLVHLCIVPGTRRGTSGGFVSNDVPASIPANPPF
jgi:hypothetical protein